MIICPNTELTVSNDNKTIGRIPTSGPSGLVTSPPWSARFVRKLIDKANAMRRGITALIVTLLLIAAPAALSQEDPGRALRLHRRSIGGVDAILGLRTARLTYDLSVNGKPAGTQVNTYGADGAFRYVITGESWSSASFDGQTAYLVNGSTRRVRSYHGPDGGPMDLYHFNRLRALALLFPLMEAEDKLGASLGMMRRERESDPMVVVATYPDGLERSFVLAPDGTLRSDSFKLQTDEIALTFKSDYSDYRSTRGAMLPGRILRSVIGTIESGGIARPVDRTEVLALRDAERNIDVDIDFIIPGRPQSLIAGMVQQVRGSTAFRFAGSVPVGDDPESIRAADLNGDGHIDLVTGDDGGVSFLPGDGEGGFPSRLLLPGGGGSNEYVLPVDIDGDGILDLAVASTSEPAERLFISKGLGRGRFEQANAFEVGDFPEVIEAADFDGDGNVDLALAHNRSGDAWVLFGDGGESFGEALILNLGGRGENLVAADLNGDRALDLLVVDQKKLKVFINSGDRGFESGVEYDAGPFPFCVATADFDGDGDIDVLVGNGGIFSDFGDNDLAFLKGNGDGKLDGADFISAGGSIASIAAADFDGDGDTDVAAASFGTHECVVLLNDGGALKPAGALPCGWSPVAVTSADFNGDGVPDLAVANEFSDNVTIWLGIK